MGRTIPIPSKETLTALVEQQMSLAQMSKELGASTVTISKWLAYHHLTPPRSRTNTDRYHSDLPMIQALILEAKYQGKLIDELASEAGLTPNALYRAFYQGKDIRCSSWFRLAMALGMEDVTSRLVALTTQGDK